MSRRGLLQTALGTSAAFGLSPLTSACRPGPQLVDKTWTNALQLDGVNPVISVGG